MGLRGCLGGSFEQYKQGWYAVIYIAADVIACFKLNINKLEVYSWLIWLQVC